MKMGSLNEHYDFPHYFVKQGVAKKTGSLGVHCGLSVVEQGVLIKIGSVEECHGTLWSVVEQCFLFVKTGSVEEHGNHQA